MILRVIFVEFDDLVGNGPDETIAKQDADNDGQNHSINSSGIEEENTSGINEVSGNPEQHQL